MWNTVHKIFCLIFKLFLGVRQITRMNIFLQDVVQVFVGIELRRIRRKKEKFNLIFTLRNPFFNDFSVMNFEIIQNQKNFSVVTFNQTTEKFNQKLLRQSVGITHKFAMTLSIYCGDHIDFFFFDRQFHDRCNTCGRKSSLIIFLVANSRFIAEENYSVFFFCLLHNFWKCDFLKFFHRMIFLF